MPATTITSTVTNRVESVLSCCAISVPRGEMIDYFFERFAAMFEALELIEAGARRRQQDRIARRRVGVGVSDRGIQRVDIHQRNRSLNLLRDLPRRRADQ